MASLVASESDDSVGSSDSPKHAGLFQSRSDDGFTSSFDDARADEEVSTTVMAIIAPIKRSRIFRTPFRTLVYRDSLTVQSVVVQFPRTFKTGTGR